MPLAVCWYVIQDWQHIQLIHVFQEQLMTGSRSSNLDHYGQNNIEALVNLQNVTSFEENFYLVVVEKVPPAGCDYIGNSPDHPGSSVVHMWRIVIASRGMYCIYLPINCSMQFLNSIFWANLVYSLIWVSGIAPVAVG